MNLEHWVKVDTWLVSWAEALGSAWMGSQTLLVAKHPVEML